MEGVAKFIKRCPTTMIKFKDPVRRKAAFMLCDHIFHHSLFFPISSMVSTELFHQKKTKVRLVFSKGN